MASRPDRPIAVGLALQPDLSWLALLDRVIRSDAVDYYQVAPETLWHRDRRGRLAPNGFWRRFATLGRETGRFFVAHGVGLSLGTADAGDRARQRRWLARIAADHRTFRFRWYTDHLGASALAGWNLALPLPLPMTPEAATAVRRRLRAMRRIVPRVGVENSVSYFLLGDPLEEPAFLRAVLAEPGAYLLLDLHNLHTMAHNLAFDPERYLADLDLARVIEIHVAGGTASDPAWLDSRRAFHLDSHDAAVPEEVWRLLAQVVPRCPRLRGVTLERMEGTVAARDVPLLAAELDRIRRLCARA